MGRKLPFRRYSWPLPRHRKAYKSDTLYGFVGAAFEFEGRDAAEVASPINALIGSLGGLSTNLRDGKSDIWRDYQQVLAEFGLIHSTNLTSRIVLTTASKMFLAGNIGYSELIGMQALRYQYPNGQKSRISAELAKVLPGANDDAVRSMITIHKEHGVLIKPMVLMLRVMLSLLSDRVSSRLTVSEIMECLVPVIRNDQYEVALRNLEAFRSAPDDMELDESDRKSLRRDIQEWVALSRETDLFDEPSDGDGIELSDWAKSNAKSLEKLCQYHENETHFWHPGDASTSDRISWFLYYGEPDLGTQAILRSETDLDRSYIHSNFALGLSEDEGASLVDSGHSAVPRIRMESLSDSRARKQSLSEPRVDSRSTEHMLERLKQGEVKRASAASLHDKIVGNLRDVLEPHALAVVEDRDSVDLFVKWPNSTGSLFEVKTVTARNLPEQMRRAIGQLVEYDYRIRHQTGIHDVDSSVVLSSDIGANNWYIGLLRDRLDFGLICQKGAGFLHYNSPGPVRGRQPLPWEGKVAGWGGN